MATTLSSRWTPFYKFVVPALSLGGMGLGAWSVYVHPERQKLPEGMSPEGGQVLFVAIFALAAIILWRLLAGLKRVELDDDELIITNYRSEMRVPLTAVETISGPSVSNPPRYSIIFAEPTELGRRITFLAPIRWSWTARGEPQEIVELRSAWEAARSGDGSIRR